MKHSYLSVKLFIMSVFVMSLFMISAYAVNIGVGTVTADALRLRAGPNITSEVLATAAKGDTVVVIEESGSWYKVNYNATEGYMSGEFLTVSATADATIGYGRVNTSDVRMRSQANTDSEVLYQLNTDTIVEITGIDNGWYKVNYESQTGYIRSDFLDITKDTPSSRGESYSGSSDSSTLGQQIVDYAEQFLGVPYVYGGSSPSGFDCSGFVYYVYAQFGYSLNRTAYNQYYYNGYSITKEELQPGDLIFFTSTSSSVGHVGMYIGDNKFVHASSGSGYCVKISSLSETGYSNRYVGCRRIV